MKIIFNLENREDCVKVVDLISGEHMLLVDTCSPIDTVDVINTVDAINTVDVSVENLDGLRDSRGVLWNIEMHTDNQKQTIAGIWKRRKGVSLKEYEQYAKMNTQMSAPASTVVPQVVPPTPQVVPPPPQVVPPTPPATGIVP